MQGVVEVDDGNFESEVLGSRLPVLLDFSAEWCGPCKRLEPIIEEIARELAGRLRVVHVDIDKAQGTAVRYGIMSVPTLLILKDGTPRDQLFGFVPKNKLIEKINPLL